MKRICVIGSINIDLVGATERFPYPGESVRANNFSEHPGGKGANQAVALGKLGADVYFIGKVGTDTYADLLLDSLEKSGVKTDFVFRDKENHTGTSLIFVNNSGENSIVNYRGANDSFAINEMNRAKEILESSDIILLQLEIPYEINTHIIDKIYKEKDKIIILDPAPIAPISDDLLPMINILTPNKVEMEQLADVVIKDESDSLKASKELINRGANVIINKLGKDGAVLVDKDFSGLIKTFDIECISSIGAGDAFNAGLAYGLSKGNNIYDSVIIGNLVASLSIAKDGVQESMPSKEELINFAKKNSLKEIII
jgi:ribokinase